MKTVEQATFDQQIKKFENNGKVWFGYNLLKINDGNAKKSFEVLALLCNYLLVILGVSGLVDLQFLLNSTQAIIFIGWHVRGITKEQAEARHRKFTGKTNFKPKFVASGNIFEMIQKSCNRDYLFSYFSFFNAETLQTFLEPLYFDSVGDFFQTFLPTYDKIYDESWSLVRVGHSDYYRITIYSHFLLYEGIPITKTISFFLSMANIPHMLQILPSYRDCSFQKQLAHVIRDNKVQGHIMISQWIKKPNLEMDFCILYPYLMEHYPAATIPTMCNELLFPSLRGVKLQKYGYTFLLGDDTFENYDGKVYGIPGENGSFEIIAPVFADVYDVQKEMFLSHPSLSSQALINLHSFCRNQMKGINVTSQAGKLAQAALLEAIITFSSQLFVHFQALEQKDQVEKKEIEDRLAKLEVSAKFMCVTQNKNQHYQREEEHKLSKLRCLVETIITTIPVIARKAGLMAPEQQYAEMNLQHLVALMEQADVLRRELGIDENKLTKEISTLFSDNEYDQNFTSNLPRESVLTSFPWEN